MTSGTNVCACTSTVRTRCPPIETSRRLPAGAPTWRSAAPPKTWRLVKSPAVAPAAPTRKFLRVGMRTSVRGGLYGRVSVCCWNTCGVPGVAVAPPVAHGRPGPRRTLARVRVEEGPGHQVVLPARDDFGVDEL